MSFLQEFLTKFLQEFKPGYFLQFLSEFPSGGDPRMSLRVFLNFLLRFFFGMPFELSAGATVDVSLGVFPVIPFKALSNLFLVVVNKISYSDLS